MDIKSDVKLGAVKSKQSGSIVISSGGTTGQKTNTATISAVDAAKSVAFNIGWETDSSGGFGGNGVRIVLTDPTTVTASSYCFQNVSATITVNFVVLEYF